MSTATRVAYPMCCMHVSSRQARAAADRGETCQAGQCAFTSTTTCGRFPDEEAHRAMLCVKPRYRLRSCFFVCGAERLLAGRGVNVLEAASVTGVMHYCRGVHFRDMLLRKSMCRCRNAGRHDRNIYSDFCYRSNDAESTVHHRQQ